jgi:hypothetical protein
MPHSMPLSSLIASSCSSHAFVPYLHSDRSAASR